MRSDAYFYLTKLYFKKISMLCLELNWFVYDPSWMLHLSEFVWTLRSSVWVVFNNFLLIDATDRSKISSDQKRLFFVNTPFKEVDSILLLLNQIVLVFSHFSLSESVSVPNIGICLIRAKERCSVMYSCNLHHLVYITLMRQK